MSDVAQGRSLQFQATGCQQGMIPLLCSHCPGGHVQDASGAYQLDTGVIVDGHSVAYPAVVSETMCFGSLQELLTRLADKPLSALQRLMIAVDAAKVTSLSTMKPLHALRMDGSATHSQRPCRIHL